MKVNFAHILLILSVDKKKCVSPPAPLFILIVLLSGLVTTGCSNLFYQPTSQMYYEPSKLNLKVEDIAIQVERPMDGSSESTVNDSTQSSSNQLTESSNKNAKENGVKVHAWLLKAEKQPSKGVLVFFHGNAQNLTAHYATLAWVLKEQYDFLIWDYRGYGISDGEPTPENTVRDGVKVIDFVSKRFPDKPLYIFAQSLGGAIALRSVIEYPDKNKIKAVIVDSTFSSYQEVSRNILARNWITWIFQPLAYVLTSDKWAPIGRLDQIAPIPLVVMHGTADRIVDYKFGKQIYDEAKDPKYFWPIEGGTHIDSFFVQNFEYRKKLLKFLQ